MANVALTVCFSITWLGFGWEPAPPPSPLQYWHWVAYLTPFLRLNPQTLKRCHMDLWLACLVLIHLHRHHHHPSVLQQHPEFRVSDLSFLSVVLFLWRAAFCPFSVKQRAAFQLSLFQYICHESSPFIWPTGPRLAASTTVSLEW